MLVLKVEKPFRGTDGKEKNKNSYFSLQYIKEHYLRMLVTPTAIT